MKKWTKSQWTGFGIIVAGVATLIAVMASQMGWVMGIGVVLSAWLITDLLVIAVFLMSGYTLKGMIKKIFG